ncbi:MAG: hypothetical protein AVDCRST_MAG70-1562, partial [uncultured Thermomicrobiales bacterium]
YAALPASTLGNLRRRLPGHVDHVDVGRNRPRTNDRVRCGREDMRRVLGADLADDVVAGRVLPAPNAGLFRTDNGEWLRRKDWRFRCSSALFTRSVPRNGTRSPWLHRDCVRRRADLGDLDVGRDLGGSLRCDLCSQCPWLRGAHDLLRSACHQASIVGRVMAIGWRFRHNRSRRFARRVRNDSILVQSLSSLGPSRTRLRASGRRALPRCTDRLGLTGAIERLAGDVARDNVREGLVSGQPRSSRVHVANQFKVLVKEGPAIGSLSRSPDAGQGLGQAGGPARPDVDLGRPERATSAVGRKPYRGVTTVLVRFVGMDPGEDGREVSSGSRRGLTTAYHLGPRAVNDVSAEAPGFAARSSMLGWGDGRRREL